MPPTCWRRRSRCARRIWPPTSVVCSSFTRSRRRTGPARCADAGRRPGMATTSCYLCVADPAVDGTTATVGRKPAGAGPADRDGPAADVFDDDTLDAIRALCAAQWARGEDGVPGTRPRRHRGRSGGAGAARIPMSAWRGPLVRPGGVRADTDRNPACHATHTTRIAELPSAAAPGMRGINDRSVLHSALLARRVL